MWNVVIYILECIKKIKRFRQHQQKPGMKHNHHTLQEAYLNIDSDCDIRRQWRGALVSSCYNNMDHPLQFGVEELTIEVATVCQNSAIWINGEVIAVRAR